MKKGLLLVNLGTAASPAPKDVRDFLDVFLSDENVIQMPKWLWQPILQKMILPKRPYRISKLYQNIWTPEGSPLMAYGIQQAKQVSELLPDWDVRLAMTYGEPNIGTTLQAMQDTGVEEVVVIPMFPQYTVTATKPIVDQVEASGVKTTLVHDYYNHPAYLKLMADDIATKWDPTKYDKLVLSYHGTPTSYARKGDPYQTQCEATTAGIIDHVPGLEVANVQHVYQSKFGPMPWLKPYLSKTLQDFPKQNVKRILIATPAFVADCLETLEEVNVENQGYFKAAGGEVYDVVAPLNGSLAFSKFLAQLANEQ